MAEPEGQTDHSTGIADSRIPVSTEVRQILKVRKAKADLPSYDALLRQLIDETSHENSDREVL